MYFSPYIASAILAYSATVAALPLNVVRDDSALVVSHSIAATTAAVLPDAPVLSRRDDDYSHIVDPVFARSSVSDDGLDASILEARDALPEPTFNLPKLKNPFSRTKPKQPESEQPQKHIFNQPMVFNKLGVTSIDGKTPPDFREPGQHKETDAYHRINEDLHKGATTGIRANAGPDSPTNDYTPPKQPTGPYTGNRGKAAQFFGQPDAQGRRTTVAQDRDADLFEDNSDTASQHSNAEQGTSGTAAS